MPYTNKLQLMVNMQAKLNDYTIPGWREKHLDWESAIIAEGAELIDPIYKWWKHGKPDVENMKVEIIDLMHFFMSYHMDAKATPVMIANEMSFQLEQMYSNAVSTFDPYAVIPVNKQFIKAVLNNELTHSFQHMSEMIVMFFPDFDVFAKGYLVKNILNTFRQNNGYKDGSYIKMWNDEEDNVVAFREAEHIELNDTFEDNLIDSLTEIYQTLTL